MKNIVVARVDDRLIHGEVVAVWTPTYSINEIVIVDDLVFNDSFNSRLLKLLAPSGVNVRVYNTEKGADYLKGDFDKNQKILLLTKSPLVNKTLVDRGVDIKELNLGGMGLNESRKPFINNVACSEDEIEAIKEMLDKGIHVYYQLVPEEKIVDVQTML